MNLKIAVTTVILLMLAAGAANGQNEKDRAGAKTAGAETASVAGGTKAAPAEAPKASIPFEPVRVDELFTEIYENYIWTLREIERIEGLSGEAEIRVSIRELRNQSQEKIVKLVAWMKEHKVPDGWSYDARGRRFLPPPGPPKAAEKK